MKASVKVSSERKIQLGMMKGLGAIYHRVTAISPHNALSREMFANQLPYEAFRTYRTAKSELDCNRAMAIVEARQTLRCL
jgi:hypothetical protein